MKKGILAIFILLSMISPIYSYTFLPQETSGDPLENLVLSQSNESEVKSWHHDCSNTSGFEYLETEHFPESWWTHTDVALESDGQSFPMPSMTNTSPVMRYYGPQYVYTLPDVFSLSGLRNFSVQMELDNDNPEYYGVVYVGLLDSSYNTVLTAKIDDHSRSESSGGCRWEYHIRNESIHTHFLGKHRWDYDMGYTSHRMEFVNMTWIAWVDPLSGLNGSIPAYGSLSSFNYAFIPAEDVETARDIKYVVLMFGGYYQYQFNPLPPFRVHDIYLEYEVGGTIDTTPPLLISFPDTVYQVGQTGNTIVWNCSDANPYRYWVLDYEWFWYESYYNNIIGGLWNGSSYTLSVDSLEVGNRTFLLILQDKAGHIVWDEVTVMVIEHPLISFIRLNAVSIGFVSFFALIIVICYWNAKRNPD